MKILVPAAVNSGFADRLFGSAVANTQVDQPGLRNQAVVSQATCPMTQALMNAGFSLEATIKMMLDSGADAEILGQCLNIDVPGLGYTPEDTDPGGRIVDPDPAPDPPSAG
jgi:hypothetical protein